MSDVNLQNVWSGWRTEGEMGRGTFGRVYLARGDGDAGAAYAAVKVIKMPPEEVSLEAVRSLGIGDDLLRTYFDKFKNDLAWELTMFKTVRSPNLVAAEETELVDDESGAGWTGYIRMPLYTPAAAYFARIAPDEGDAVNIGRDIGAALAACESFGMAHGDVKPENVMVSDAGGYALADYGIKKSLEKAGSGLFKTEMGDFDAPELASERKYTPASDVYSLGMLMMWAANGGALPSGRNPALVKADEGLMAVIRKAVAYEPAQRYQSAAQLLADLNALPVVKAPRRAVAAAAAVEAVRRTAREQTAGQTPPAPEEAPVRSAAEEAERERKKKRFLKLMTTVCASLVLVAALAAAAIWLPKQFKNTAKTDDKATSGQSGQPAPGGDTARPDDGQTEPAVPDKTDTPEPQTGDSGNSAVEGTGQTGQTAQPGTDVPADSGSTGSTDNSGSTGNADNSGSTGNSGSSGGKTTPSVPAKPDPVIAPAPSDNYFILPTDTDLITLGDLEGMDATESSMVINEIYARHGKIFKTGSIQKYFEAQSWYKPVTEDSAAIERLFSATEKANVTTVSDYQKLMGYRSGAPSRNYDETPADTAPAEQTPPAEGDTEPVQAETPKNDYYILPTDSRLITIDELEGMDRSESYMVINEIYARHGKIFSTKSVREYFESQAWYVPVTEDSAAIEAQFSDIERTNLETVAEYQRQKGYR